MADDKKARELLEKIRRLPHNKRCANCDKEAPPGGHGDICVKFGTFVCSTCKSAHQSFSHRCKSVTLSNWTTHEVLALKDEAGGGNAHARKTWLGKLEKTGLVLRPDHPLEKVKAFVDEAYNRKCYWVDADGHGHGGANSSSSRPTTQGNHSGATPSSSGASSGVRPPTPPPATSSSSSCKADDFGSFRGAGAPAADFLDFAADFSDVPPVAAAAPAHAQSEWQRFQAGPGAANGQGQQQQQGNGSSAFGFISAPAPAAPAPSDHFGDFMAAAPAPVQQPPMQQQQQQQQTQAPKPVMLSSVRALGDDPFAGLHHPPHPPHSSFGAAPAGPRPMGMGMGMGMGFPGGQPQLQPPRPAPGMGMGMGMGGGMMGAPPMMAPPRPPMGMSMGGAPPANGIPGCGFVVPSGPSTTTPRGGGNGGPMPMMPPMGGMPMGPRPAMGMGVGGMGFGATTTTAPSSSSSLSYKPQEPDPFASLDAAWRNK